MISCILGKAGSGKSYEAVRMARAAAEAGRHVMTNLPLQMEQWEGFDDRIHVHDDTLRADGWLAKAKDWDDLLEQRFLTGEGDEQKGPLVIIDEVVRVFSPVRLRGTSANLGEQRQHATLIQTSVENLIATHRHARLDVVFLGQTFRQLPEWLRPQIHEWIELKNHVSAGLPGYTAHTFDTWHGFRTPVRTFPFRRYDKKVFGLYRSHAMAGSDIGEGKDKAYGYGHTKWWMRWQIWLFVGSLVAVGGWGIPTAFDLISKLTGDGDPMEIDRKSVV